jgi:hypothetical protein
VKYYDLTDQQMKLSVAISEELSYGNEYFLEDGPGYATIRREMHRRGREEYSEVWTGKLSRTNLHALQREGFLHHVGGLRYRVASDELLDAVRRNFVMPPPSDHASIGDSPPDSSVQAMTTSPEDARDKPMNKGGKDQSDYISAVPTAFISYSWDSEPHKQWVKDLATRLRNDGIDVTLDQWHTVPGDQLPKFMETSIRENDYVLIICTPPYKAKSENRKGGAGYEGDIITGDIFINQNRRKYIPVLRDGSWSNAVPVWIAGVYGLDFTGDYAIEKYQELLGTLKGEREQAPPLGKPMTASSPARIIPSRPEDEEVWQDIRIVGVILDQVTSPRNDGSRGSALYKVPFQLSRRPSEEWSQVFEYTFDHPPSWTTMHRPGIAHIVGDRLFLDGTTIEEVEKYHLNTLKLVLKETNDKIREHESRKQAQAKAAKEQEEKHRQNLNNIARRLDFDSDDA